ncbi:AraC family transcriptional regulator [Paenibacillus albidus]|uniref:AraC family transcriptional regulator n=1 Tax=Paenibacillus albidus TaxID=2041023 RepID=A0A917CA88_9BACL|nr:AraC family transcriptional regulator [Paenibacillus albidus]GGF78825.1 AraC family transcriptional regulator [Paenibacillus albidus]
MQTLQSLEYEELYSHYNKYLSEFLPYSSNNRYTDLITLPESIGSGMISRTRLRPGMEIIIADCRMKDVHTMQLHGNLPMVDLTFWIQGNIEILHSGTQEQISPGLGHLTFGLEQQLELKYAAGVPITICEIRLATALFDELMDELGQARYSFALILDGRENRIFHQSILPKVQSILQDIRSHPFAGPMRKMFLEGKTLELLALWFQQTLFEDEVSAQRGGIRLRKEDIARVREASEILEKRMEQPPSLLELSKLAGISDSKLKSGFKELFGTTVFGYLKEKRLDKAKELLEMERINVCDAAIMVGYSNPSHFAAIFRERFGCNPREWIIESKRL